MITRERLWTFIDEIEAMEERLLTEIRIATHESDGIKPAPVELATLCRIVGDLEHVRDSANLLRNYISNRAARDKMTYDHVSEQARPVFHTAEAAQEYAKWHENNVSDPREDHAPTHKYKRG